MGVLLSIIIVLPFLIYLAKDTDKNLKAQAKKDK